MPGHNKALNLNLHLDDRLHHGLAPPERPWPSALAELARRRSASRRERRPSGLGLWRACSAPGAGGTQAELDAQMERQFNASAVQDC